MSAHRSLEEGTSLPKGDDERALLKRLELLLDRESALLAARDADGLAALADERERIATRIAGAARERQVAERDPQVEAELLALYERLRRRHDVQAQIVRRHAERTGRAIGVLAQATGQTNLYKSDGRVAMQFVAV